MFSNNSVNFEKAQIIPLNTQMQVSLITVVYNAQDTIADAVQSVISQQGVDFEYIVIDGASSDNTLGVLTPFKESIHLLISEKDKGMYDALNKGIALAKGEVIGILNADDMLADNGVLHKVMETFQNHHVDGVYGDLNYVNRINPEQIIRKWKSKQVDGASMKFGWMPAHPTLYLKRELFEKYGNYSLHFGSAADYELMLRFIYKYRIKIKYLPMLLVNMRVGGMSNQSIKHRWKALLNDWKAARNNGISFPVFTMLFKKLGKLTQYL